MKKPRTIQSAISLIIIYMISGLLHACSKEFEAPIRDEVWIPQYVAPEHVKDIKLLSPILPITGGKIYIWNNNLFQIETNKGVHIYKMEDKIPRPIHFLQVIGAQEIAIKDGYLYTNNLNDIIVINLNDLDNLIPVSRIENVFTLNQTVIPPEHGYFECVDHSKGLVIGWELKKNIRAKCKY